MAFITNFVKHTFITIDKRRSHKKKRDNEYYSKKYQYDNDDVIGCQGSEYTVSRNKLENDYESRNGSEIVNYSIMEKYSLPAAKNSLTNEIQEARDKAEMMKADYEEKKAKKEREIIAADENYCELVSKHQEEYGSLEQEIAALSGTCDQLREQLARAGEQLLMLQCKQAEEKQTAEEGIMKAAEKRRQLLSQLIAEKNTTANAVKMAFAEVEHLIEKGSAEDRSHSEQYLSGTQPQQKDAADILPKAGYKNCKLSPPSQSKMCQIKSC